MKKALNLEVLRNHGFRTPKGFTLAPEHFKSAIKPIMVHIRAALKARQSVTNLILSLPLPAAVIDAINESLKQFTSTDRFAVRSSGAICTGGKMIGEDSESVSLAGQFESFLNVPRSEVPKAIRQCWASLFNDRTVSRFGLDESFLEKSVMGVLVQEMIPAKSCAVMMTVEPHGKGDTGAVEFSWGACEGIVSGVLTPDEAIFLRPGGDLISKRLGRKECIIAHSDYGGPEHNSRKIITAEADRKQFAMTDSQLAELIQIGLSIERLFGVPQDIEAVTSTTGELYVVQARPVTILPKTINAI